MDDEFYAPRASFLPPIPELDAAADLLAQAADNLLAGDETQARSNLSAANTPTLRAYTRSIASQVTHEIHRFRHVPGLTDAVPMKSRGPRQPSASIALNIYRRDGFRCRYCGCRIVYPGAQNVISALLPGAVQWGSRDIELNAAFYTLKGVLDHVVPHAHGGTSDAENIVTSCQPCNYGKGSYFLQQFGLSDPRLRPPNVDEWDGLLRVLPLRPPLKRAATEPAGQQPIEDKSATSRRRSAKPKPGISIDDFASGFSVSDRRHLDTLLQAVGAASDLGLSWTLKHVLLVKIPVGKSTIEVLGVEPDGTVQIPWSIGPYKQAFRPFAETLAASLPGGTTHETEKMWRVRCFGHMPRIADLITDQNGWRASFEALHTALSNFAKQNRQPI